VDAIFYTFYPEDGSSTFLKNIGTSVSKYRTSHPRRQNSSSQNLFYFTQFTHPINTWVTSKVLHTVCFLFKNVFILQNTFTGLQCKLHCALSQNICNCNIVKMLHVGLRIIQNLIFRGRISVTVLENTSLPVSLWAESETPHGIWADLACSDFH
jgi:hypothetical protein